MPQHDPTHCIVFDVTAVALRSNSRLRRPPHVQCIQVLCTAKVVGNGAAKAIVIERPEVVARRTEHCDRGVLYQDSCCVGRLKCRYALKKANQRKTKETPHSQPTTISQNSNVHKNTAIKLHLPISEVIATLTRIAETSNSPSLAQWYH